MRRKAADKLIAPAQYNLDSYYFQGVRVERNHEEAVKWFRKAAEQNEVLAQFNLGLCHVNGIGVKVGFSEAYAWFHLAASANGEAAKHRDFLATQMSPQQVADVKKHAEELRV